MLQVAIVEDEVESAEKLRDFAVLTQKIVGMPEKMTLFLFKVLTNGADGGKVSNNDIQMQRSGQDPDPTTFQRAVG